MSTTFPYRVFCSDGSNDNPLVVFDVMATDISAAVAKARSAIESREWGYPDPSEWIDVTATVSPVLPKEFVRENAPYIDIVVTVRNRHRPVAES